MRKHTLSLVCLVVGSLALTTSALAKPKLGVIGLEAIDSGSADSQKATASLAQWLTRGLRARASHARSQFDVAPDAGKELTEVRLDVDCWEDNVDCMVKIGKKLNADRIVYGTLEKKNNQYTITLKLLNVQTAEYENRKTNVFPESEGTKNKAKALAKTYFAEITGIANGGTLIVRANVDTGTLLIDGQPRGTIVGGQAKVEGLDGTVAVSVESPGYTRWDGEATVKNGKVSNIKAELTASQSDTSSHTIDKIVIPDERQTIDPQKKWRMATWAGVAVTAGGLVVMGITGPQVGSKETDKSVAVMESRMTGNMADYIVAGEGDDACKEAADKINNNAMVHDSVLRLDKACNSGESLARMFNLSVGISSIAAAATLFFVYKAYIEEPSISGVDRTASRAPNVIVVPVVYPDGGGVGAMIRF